MKNENPLWDQFPEELKSWLKSESARWSKNEDANEILQQLSGMIADGKIVVSQGNQVVFDLMETKFPIGLNRIDWEHVTETTFIDVLNLGDGQEIGYDEQIEKLNVIRKQLGQIIPNVPEDAIKWIGDDCDLILTMDKNTFLSIYPILFSSPQHSYVLSSGCDWCLNYTMEGHLYFGRSANAVKTGFDHLTAD